MQREPIQFGAVAAARAKRSAAGFTLPIRSARSTASDMKTACALDEAFADFTRVDAGSHKNKAAIQSTPQDSPLLPQALIANIATQLEAFDNQRRRLSRLLEIVDGNTTV